MIILLRIYNRQGYGQIFNNDQAPYSQITAVPQAAALS